MLCDNRAGVDTYCIRSHPIFYGNKKRHAKRGQAPWKVQLCRKGVRHLGKFSFAEKGSGTLGSSALQKRGQAP